MSTAGSPGGRTGTEPLRGVGVVAGNELLRLVRDRVGMFFVLVLPVVIILMLGLTLFGQSDRFDLGVVDLDDTPESAALIEALDSRPSLLVERHDDLRAVERDMRTGSLNAGVVIPEGYGAALTTAGDAGATGPSGDMQGGGDGDGGDDAAASGGEPEARVMLVTEPAESTTNAIRSAVTSVVGEQGARLAAARFATEVVPGSGLEENLVLADELAAASPTMAPTVTEIGSGSGVGSSGFDFAVPSQLTLFVFINSLTAATALVEARRLGVLRRMLGAPVRATTIVGGLGVSRWVFALTQGVLIVVVGAALGVSWGSAPGVVAVLVLFGAVSAAAGLILGSVVRTPEQAMAIGIPVGLGLAMLGGCLWPLEIVSPNMNTIGHLTPHAWAMDSWITLIYDGGGLADIWVELAVLAAMAAASVVAAGALLRRQLLS